MEDLQTYPELFFELQLIFAQKVAEMCYQPIQDVLLRYTALYRILGLDWSFNPTHPIWLSYLQGLQQESISTEWTYQFYLGRYHEIPKFSDEAHWGCFSYDYKPDSQVIHLHFSNQDSSGYGPLSHHRVEARLTELRTMFIHIKQTHPDATIVRGGSWLYNRKSYRRLFPAEYILSALVTKPNLQARSTWGQLLRHDWQVNEETRSLFLQRVSQLRDVQQCTGCFPYQTLSTEASIRSFYDFYGIEATMGPID